MMFTATDDVFESNLINDYFLINTISDVLTTKGWVNVKELSIGDCIVSMETNEKSFVKGIEIVEENHNTYAKIYI